MSAAPPPAVAVNSQASRRKLIHPGEMIFAANTWRTTMRV